MSDHADESPEPDDERPGGHGTFVFVIPCAILFVVTIFAMIATAFGDPASPLGRFFDRHGVLIILVEALVLAGASLVAMSLDRWVSRPTVRPSDEDG